MHDSRSRRSVQVEELQWAKFSLGRSDFEKHHFNCFINGSCLFQDFVSCCLEDGHPVDDFTSTYRKETDGLTERIDSDYEDVLEVRVSEYEPDKTEVYSCASSPMTTDFTRDFDGACEDMFAGRTCPKRCRKTSVACFIDQLHFSMRATD